MLIYQLMADNHFRVPSFERQSALGMGLSFPLVTTDHQTFFLLEEISRVDQLFPPKSCSQALATKESTLTFISSSIWRWKHYPLGEWKFDNPFTMLRLLLLYFWLGIFLFIFCLEISRGIVPLWNSCMIQGDI